MIHRIRDALLHHQIRAKAAIHETPLDRYRVRIARDVREYEDAFHLLHIAYVYQGIEAVRSNKMRITPQHVLPEATVFVAYEGEQCVGTMTVTLDSPVGLPLENDYPQELDSLRVAGARPVEYGSLAVVRRCWSTGVTVLLNMAATYWAMNMLRASDVVMGINPKAAPVYRAMYGFRQLGEVKHHSDLTAPVKAMVLDLEKAVPFMRKHHPKPLGSGLTMTEHSTRRLPDCVEIPAELRPRDLARWKLPRAVFQEIFIDKSSRLDTLDPTTLAYLKQWRSNQTLDERTRQSQLRVVHARPNAA